MLIGSLERIRNGFVRTLQLAFQTNSQFRWDSDPERSNITISDQWPQREVKLPAIIVTAISGDSLQRTFGNVRKQVTQSMYLSGATREVISALQFGGNMSPVVSIEVAAHDPVVRDRLVDWLQMYAMWFFTDKLKSVGLEIQGMNWISNREEYIGNQPVYISGLSIDLLTEWKHTVTIEDANRLDAITIANLFIINYDGTTTSSY